MMSESRKAKTHEGLRGSRFDLTVYIHTMKVHDNIPLSLYNIMNVLHASTYVYAKRYLLINPKLTID